MKPLNPKNTCYTQKSSSPCLLLKKWVSFRLLPIQTCQVRRICGAFMDGYDLIVHESISVCFCGWLYFHFCALCLNRARLASSEVVGGKTKRFRDSLSDLPRRHRISATSPSLLQPRLSSQLLAGEWMVSSSRGSGILKTSRL